MVMKAGQIAVDVIHEREQAIQFWEQFTRAPVEAGRVDMS
jgi:hypothetical protein